MNRTDYARSYLRFRTDRVNHTPRLQVDASCRLFGKDGSHREFFLSCPCIGESMYLREELIHQPAFEFLLIAEPGVEFAIQKRHADAAQDVHAARRLGEAMPTRSGVAATVNLLEVHRAHFERAQLVTSYAEFRAALLENRPINGRTTYRGEDGETTVVLEYPAKTVNMAEDQPAWQVDAGPVLLPDLNAPADLLVGKLRVGYLVFNRWDYAEAVIREECALGPGLATAHFGGTRRLEARNELTVVW